MFEDLNAMRANDDNMHAWFENLVRLFSRRKRLNSTNNGAKITRIIAFNSLVVNTCNTCMCLNYTQTT